nr:hypothetical protein [uncultured Thiodictyon sp.]
MHDLEEDVLIVLAEFFAGVADFDAGKRGDNGISKEAAFDTDVSDREQRSANKVVGNPTALVGPQR